MMATSGKLKVRHFQAGLRSTLLRLYPYRLYSKNYYTMLELTPKADQSAIKQAYLRLSKIWHPDLHISETKERAESKFKRLAEAYAVLSDTEKRRAYDEQMGFLRPADLGTQPRGVQRETPANEVQPPFGRVIKVDLSDARMEKAWEAYKKRWMQEEARLEALSKLKTDYRVKLDHLRENYHNLSECERNDLRENMRLFRNPFQEREQAARQSSAAEQQPDQRWSQVLSHLKKSAQSVKHNYQNAEFLSESSLYSDKYGVHQRSNRVSSSVLLMATLAATVTVVLVVCSELQDPLDNYPYLKELQRTGGARPDVRNPGQAGSSGQQ